ASPKPWIDVWYLQQGAADALWHGYDPYSVAYPNIYGRMANISYPPELLVNGRLVSFCYPPLVVLVDLPARLLLGDIRYVSLALMLFAAWAIARLARGPEGELAALFILFQPRTFFVLEQSWIELLLLAAIALTALLSVRSKGPIAAGVALGLLLASKQYSPYFALPLFLTFPKEGRWKSLLVAAGVAAAVLVPFAAWDWHGFWRGLVTWHFLLDSRDDALSLMALWNRHGGAPAFAVSLVPFLGVVLLAATLRWRITVAQAVAFAGAAFLLVWWPTSRRSATITGSAWGCSAPRFRRCSAPRRRRDFRASGLRGDAGVQRGKDAAAHRRRDRPLRRGRHHPGRRSVEGRDGPRRAGAGPARGGAREEPRLRRQPEDLLHRG